MHRKQCNSLPRKRETNVQQIFSNRQRKTTRFAAVEYNFKQFIVYTVLKKVLYIPGYKLQIIQIITPLDWVSRKQFAVSTS